MRIETKRLILREWENKDSNDLINGINDLDVTKWLLVVPYPYKKKDAKLWISHCKKSAKDKKRANYEFAVELKEEGKLIGCFSLNKIDKFQKTATLGYWLSKNYHGKGYGTEALKELIKFAFNKLKLRRLNASVFLGNPSSGKILEKFGAKKEGLKRKADVCKADKKVKDEVVYGLLKEEWKK